MSSQRMHGILSPPLQAFRRPSMAAPGNRRTRLPKHPSNAASPEGPPTGAQAENTTKEALHERISAAPAVSQAAVVSDAYPNTLENAPAPEVTASGSRKSRVPSPHASRGATDDDTPAAETAQQSDAPTRPEARAKRVVPESVKVRYLQIG